MFVKQLKLENFRNYDAATVNLPVGLIFITGSNGAGKTNFIEAIALAALGRSPRTTNDGQLIKHNTPAGRVKLSVVQKHKAVEIEIRLHRREGKSLLWNNQPLRRRSDLVGRLPLVTFFPDDLGLVKGPPGQRRRFLDLLAAQCEPRHVHDVAQFQQVLRQRNSLLKNIRRGSAAASLANMFDEQFVKASVNVIRRRLHFLSELKTSADAVQKVVGNENLSVRYFLSSGQTLAADQPLGRANLLDLAQEQLAASARREQKRGYSLWGPHRDDMIITVNGFDAKTYSSQGQQRTAVLALKLAEIELLTTVHGESPLVIFDDVLSELDPGRIQSLLRRLVSIEQVFVTTADPLTQPKLPVGAVFKVRNGQITKRMVANSG